MRRIATRNRTRMVPARRRRRRRRRRRTPRVHDDRVSHHDCLLGWLDSRPVAVGAESRPVGMRDDLHTVADRTERPVNVTSVDPRSGRHTAGRKRDRRSCQNRHEVLVHDPPPFPHHSLHGGSKRQISIRRRADQPADNGANCHRTKRNPAGVAAVVMDVVNDMMPRRRRRTMRTMPSVPRPCNRRTSRQNRPSHENRNCLDDLVHITPTFPDFLSLHKVRKHHRQNLTSLLNHRVAIVGHT